MTTVDGLGPGSVPERHPSVVGVELDGQAVLYHEELNTVHLLDPIATIIWNGLGGRELAAMARDLAAAFGADVNTVTADVVEGVRAFGHQGLLRGVEADEVDVAVRRLEEPEITGEVRHD